MLIKGNIVLQLKYSEKVINIVNSTSLKCLMYNGQMLNLMDLYLAFGRPCYGKLAVGQISGIRNVSGSVC